MTKLSFQPRLWPSIMAGLMFVVLLALGFWQVQRGMWKDDLLAKLEARLDLPIRTITPNDFDKPHELYYQPIQLTAAVEAAKPFSIFRRHENTGALGLQIYIPLRFTGKKWFLLKSVFSSDADAPFRFDLPVMLQGTGMIIPFDSHDALLNDLPKGMEITALPPPQSIDKTELAGFVFVPLQGMPEEEVRKLKDHMLTLPNNHKSYSFIWFSLAFILLVIYLCFSLKK